MDTGESPASIARRARVLAWRVMSGELVQPEAGDPATAVMLELLSRPHPLRVSPGVAHGAIATPWHSAPTDARAAAAELSAATMQRLAAGLWRGRRS